MSTVGLPSGAFSSVGSAQLFLFDPGINLTSAREGVEELMAATQSDNTQRAYRYAWGVFVSWCVDAGRESLPASPETLRLFVSWCVRDRRPIYRLETVRALLSAVRSYHLAGRLPSPVDDSVKALVRSAARRLCEKPAGSAALTPVLLRKICSAAVVDGSPGAVRDRAIVLLGFAGAFRRSEVAALAFDDVRFVRKGLEVGLWRTKTDQLGAGRLVGISRGSSDDTCPVRALRAWLRLRGSSPGPLFVRVLSNGTIVDGVGISGDAVNQVVKFWLGVVGVDAGRLTSHSLRVGFVTAAGEEGVSPFVIMKRTGHKTVQMVQHYLRPVDVFSAADPLVNVL